MNLEEIDMLRAKHVVARIAKAYCGCKWEDENHVNTLTDSEVIQNLIFLADVAYRQNQTYVNRFEKVLNSLELEGEMFPK